MTNEERRALTNLEIETAERFMLQAEKNAEIEEWDVVSNRLYYSLFHAVSALLLTDSHPVSSHKDAIVMFGQYYVKTGIFTAEEGRFYSQLHILRDRTDYDVSWQSTENDTKPMIAPTKALLAKIKSYIRTKCE